MNGKIIRAHEIRVRKIRQKFHKVLAYRWPDDYEEDPNDIIDLQAIQEEMYEEIVRNPLTRGEPFVPPSQRTDMPLAGILHPELEDVDPR